MKKLFLFFIASSCLFASLWVQANNFDRAKKLLKSDDQGQVSHGLNLLETALTAKEKVDKKTFKKIAKSLQKGSKKLLSWREPLQLRALDLYKTLCKRGYARKREQEVARMILNKKKYNISARVRALAVRVLAWAEKKKRM